MDPREIYRVVYETTGREADNREWKSKHHKDLAKKLPDPNRMSYPSQ